MKQLLLTLFFSFAVIISASAQDITVDIADVILQLESGDVLIETDDDIFINGNLAAVLTEDRTLTFRAGGDIYMQPSSQITASGAALNVIFWSDTDGSGEGMVWIQVSSSIDTNNGHLWIGGGDGSVVWNGLTVGDGFAEGNTPQNTASDSNVSVNGVSIDNLVTISTGAGNVGMFGRSGTNMATDTYSINLGVLFGAGAQLFTTSGDVYVEGETPMVSQDPCEAAFCGYRHGVMLHGDNVADNIIQTESGSVTLIGSNQAFAGTDSMDSAGVVFFQRGNNATISITSETGDIVISSENNATAAAPGRFTVGMWVLSRPVVIGSDTGRIDITTTIAANNLQPFFLGPDTQIGTGGSGDITITTNNVSALSPTVSFEGTGNLRFQPSNPSGTIGLGGAPGTLQLLEQYFDVNIQPGFESVIIGRDDLTGGVQVNSVAMNNSLAFEASPASSVTLNADQSLVIPDGITLDILGSTVFNVAEGASITAQSGSLLRTGVDSEFNNLGSVTIGSGAYFWYDGTITGEFTAERLISSPDFSSSNGHWITLGSPVTNALFAEGDINNPENEERALLSSILTQGFVGSNFPSSEFDSNVFVYNEDGDAAGKDGRFELPETNEIQEGLGFIVYLFETKDPSDPLSTVDFDVPFSATGSLASFSAGSYSYPISYSGASSDLPDDGWNLLTNPFAVPLDWGSSAWSSRDAFNGFMYIYNPETKQYRIFDNNGTPVINGGSMGVIQPFQAFWVKAEESGASLEFGDEARTLDTDNSTFFRGPEPAFVELSLQAGELSSSAAFRFGSEYSETFSRSDAYFLSPLSSSFAYLYTLKDGRSAQINSLSSDLTEEVQIPLAAGAFKNSSFYDGEATISWEGTDNYPQHWSITLVDMYTGEVIDLRKNSQYTFTMQSGMMGKMNDISEVRSGNSPMMDTKFAGERFVLNINPEQPTDTPVEGDLPRTFALEQNYPNPFNPTTQIRFDLPESSEVRLDVFNVQGQRVATLVNEGRSAGTHTVTFDATNLSSGVYLYRLQAGSQVLTNKMTLVR
ncbi:MAG: T9SS type A sorting domain-containing protein [Balneolia bacterium]|nr:T9SS type A sorting domain-containing protein [Balneolia bacterium]